MRYCLPAGVLALLGVCLLGLSGCARSPPAGRSGEVARAPRVRPLNDNEQALVMRQARFPAAAGRRDYEATIIAMGHPLAALSQDMAATLLTIVQQASRRE